VWVVNTATGGLTLTPVKVGRYTQDAVEVLDGLKPGDTVVRAGVHKLFATDKVRVVQEPGK
jgi:multidrug efflux system membrane fusion protein